MEKNENNENLDPHKKRSSEIEETSQLPRKDAEEKIEGTIPKLGSDGPENGESEQIAEEQSSIEETIAIQRLQLKLEKSEGDDLVSNKTSKDGKSISRGSIRLVMLGIILLIVGLSIGSGLGYNSAIQRRVREHNDQVALITATQYQLGLQDLIDGRYEIARKRFEYVIRLDPKFPGAADQLTDVMLFMAMENDAVIPTVIAPEIQLEITPTPDTRGNDELFVHTQTLMQNEDWVGAIVTLESLRKANLDYRAVEVDGLYYISLRNRGMDKILKEGNLEGGIYDLTLVERFGPIDKEADNFRTWARLYLAGASFWEVDWGLVVNYFSQVYPSLPNLRDGSNMTATERYRIASLRYGEQLMRDEDWCNAEIHIQNALSLKEDPFIAPTATQVALECRPGEEEPEAAETPSP
jgi:hypothetical protein